MKISKTVLAYFAGFVDGEGCISITSKTRHKKYTSIAPKVIVVQKTKEVLEEIQLYFGGCLRLKKYNGVNKSDIYAWGVSNQKAYIFVKAIYPYLRIKKAEATLLLEYNKLVANNKHKKLTKEVVLKRLQFKNKMHDLKRRVVYER